MRDQAAHPKQLSSCPGQSALSTPGSLPASSGWTPGAPPAWLSLHGQRWVLSTCPQHWPCCGVSINPPPLEVGSKPPPGQGPDVETAWRGWASSSVGGVHLKAVTLMSGLPPNATPFPSAHPEPKEVRETRFITLSSKFSDSLLGLLVLCSKPSSPSPKLPLPRPFWNQHPCVTGLPCSALTGKQPICIWSLAVRLKGQKTNSSPCRTPKCRSNLEKPPGKQATRQTNRVLCSTAQVNGRDWKSIVQGPSRALNVWRSPLGAVLYCYTCTHTHTPCIFLLGAQAHLKLPLLTPHQPHKSPPPPVVSPEDSCPLKHHLLAPGKGHPGAISGHTRQPAGSLAGLSTPLR
ncbi:28S ribosomal protein S11, mitochondrial isoform X1 [Talpa occidentalis]|uniref:28S ribosomal protein S11, mitochondrial isoform X1 n=1 Tax=Talpa occidentalis TaxID=50954 RepID=UPI0023F7046A|nr:28S ribosomal protein S11, mitochondrial isoform X1 [Talpa occidentalis]